MRFMRMAYFCDTIHIMIGIEIVLFIIGLFVGSFLNVVADRLSKGESIVFPPSHCENCNHRLAPKDLIPVLSYLYLGGKCRYCKKPFSWQYPLVEFITGVLFAAAAITIPFLDAFTTSFSLVNLLYVVSLYIFISVNIVVFFADMRYGIIPDEATIVGSLVTLLTLVIHSPFLFVNHLLSAAGAFLFFLLLFLGTRGRGMGFGDVKYVLFLGLFFGYPNSVIVLYLAFLTGALVSIILILQGRKRLKATIPFGPFLVISALLVFFFGKFITTLLWFIPLP